MQTEIKQWGNSAAVRLPSKLLAALQLEVSSAISIEIKDNKIIIEAIPEEAGYPLGLPISEKELLKGLNPETAHADGLAQLDPVEFDV